MEQRKIRQFCKTVAQASKYGLLTKQQAKTLMGQAKHGDLGGAMVGLQRVMGR